VAHDTHGTVVKKKNKKNTKKLLTKPPSVCYNKGTKREELRAMKNANYSIKGYAMGDYKYEWGTQLPWQKEIPGGTYTVKCPLTEEELAYWKAYFHKKYNGNFAKGR
jgi:hypothetical protein